MNARERARRALGALRGEAPRLWRAPGRVNLIGEHVDYHDGLVCPAAIAPETAAAVLPRDDGIVRVVSDDLGASATFALPDPGPPRGAWSDYVAGTAQALVQTGRALRGADLAIASDVPAGAGLSSSAALALAAGAALLDAAGLPLDRRALAAAARAGENGYVGVATGIMDQLVCAFGEAGRALRIDCRDGAIAPVALPPEATLLILDSGVRHRLADGGYDARRRESEAAASVLGRPLRDADPAAVETLADPLLRRRARHVVTEIARVERFVDALRAGDLAAAGAAMRASHASLRDDYEVSVPELDLLVASANRIDGCWGARMTGGGFGGSAIALVRPQSVQAVIDAVDEGFTAAYGRVPEHLVTPACDGVSALDVAVM